MNIYKSKFLKPVTFHSISIKKSSNTMIKHAVYMRYFALP